MGAFRDKDTMESVIDIENIKILFTKTKPHAIKIENANGYVLYYAAVKDDTQLESLLKGKIKDKELVYEDSVIKGFLEGDELTEANKKKLKSLLGTQSFFPTAKVVMALLVVCIVAAGVYFWRKKNAKESAKNNALCSTSPSYSVDSRLNNPV